ncbi:MAG TPA: hypothetical protein VF153_02105, partial [Candidatus Limnocylindria bacterium]
TAFPAGSPQAAMQAYLAAWQERDIDAAYGYFSTEIKASTSLDDYRRVADGFGKPSPDQESVFIDGAELDGDRATLHLTIERYFGDGPGSEVDRSTSSVRMVREADGWKIDEPLLGPDPAPFPFDERPADETAP